MLGSFTQQPAEKEAYTVNYALDLNQGDRVTNSVATVSPGGLTIVKTTVIDNSVRILLAGGTHSVRYKITVTTDTAEGRVMQDEFMVKVREL